MDSEKLMKAERLKLIMAGFGVYQGESEYEMRVYFNGPKNCCYSNGKWAVLVKLSEKFPYKAPILKFVNPPFHPNIDEISGEICMDEIQEDWKPEYGLVKVFTRFLPRLLTYPTLTNPLNTKAATEMKDDLEGFHSKADALARTMALVLATEEASAAKEASAEESSSTDS